MFSTFRDIIFIIEKSVESKTAFLLLAAATIFMQSCLNEEVCEDVSALPVRIGFFEEVEDDDEPNPISVDSLTIYGLGSDSIIYNNQRSVSQVEVPLNPATDSCAFIFRLPGNNPDIESDYDTIWFYYSTQPVLISMDCGFVSFYELQKINYTTNLIDSISLDINDVTSSLDEHIKIFPAVFDTEE